MAIRPTADYARVTPADWRDREDVIVGTDVSNEEVGEKCPGYAAKKPHLRVTGQPKP